ncbi:SDR family oxidoreductase [Pseudomaricurvus alkylphenolicus]|uniref:SDR family NAD(P)-dependent oxidoreductase n=1 Tax=Pseudomaricurvus alkylphenolicus TaxID=1306991 RepID=UPI00142441BF|nr:SDR family oxidoreductase [Pseudomaricurvus alkylphenolicus]NIB43503.1 SDR family oxidoreductase [Pseudomaricurvus alkylphenolicus]
MSKLAIVTGAAGGIGSATVRRLVSDGYKVAALDINEQSLEEVKAESPANIEIYPVNLTDVESTRAVVQRIESEMGPIYALANVIGWTATSKFVDEAPEYWDKVIDINYKSVLYITHAVIPAMIERKVGRIVTVTSDAGKVGTSGEAVYGGTKGALIAWSKSIARELARYSINVNCTAPGPTNTPLEAEQAAQDPETFKRRLKVIPFRRLAEPAEQAAMISFLCSDDSEYITGQVFSVSGGLTMS